jgi:O-antigen/teichoic acid export membrane protein
MKKLVSSLWNLGLSKTAKNTYILFSGNLIDAVMSFVFSVLVFKTLTTADFGIFSAINNFVIVCYSLLDIGISGSLINFISYYRGRGQDELAKKYFQTGIFLRGTAALIVSILVISFSWIIAPKFFLTTQTTAIVIAGLAIFVMSFLDLFYYSFQAYQKFFYSAITSSLYTCLRVLFVLSLSLLSPTMSITTIMIILTLAPLVGIGFALYNLKSQFSFAIPDFKILKKLVSFGGWLGVTRVFASITGRMDVQMVLLLMTPSDAGIYSVAARIASFYSVVVTSFTSVLAPKLAAGTNLSELKPFVVKSSLVVIGLIAAMGLGVVIAKPFIILLFGIKAAGSVVPFQALTLAFMPFVASIVATTIIVYNLKKPKILGLMSILQFVLVVVGNLIFIPKFGSLGPAVTLGITNLVVLIISGVCVWRYWK